jgi:splicing factor 3A subunit 3
MAKWETQFEEEWEAGTIEGWEDKGAGVTGYVDTVVDLDSYSSAEELLEAADMETIKLALQSLGMKVGGTPLQRAQRLFCTKGQALETLDAKLFVKGAAPVIHNEGSASIQVGGTHPTGSCEF